ncbi:hypothetical protein QWY90_03000 [Flavobacterium paronense]|uniref:DUF4390 domain-containing protein n=1 Tax=Flavobacterium paronense TaxID=1392775 RepID=A0ABV5GCU7_9FLAO|nr:hypothetical protein [Flavobacterium paronense]MDN3676274.1 hypothetical protein [Flavobacterium paronense]
MKHKLFLFVLLTTATFSFAQKKDKREGNYSIQLISAESPKDIQHGTVDSLSSTYEDAIIKINWQYAVSQIGFDLTNKSEKTIKLIWDEAAYISIENVTERIFHKGIKYIDRENSQTPSSIYKNSTLSDLISPTSYTRFVSGQYGGWVSSPLIPTMSAGMFSKKVEYKPELLGKTVRVVLPLKMEEKTLEYVFVFKTIFLEKNQTTVRQ